MKTHEYENISILSIIIGFVMFVSIGLFATISLGCSSVPKYEATQTIVIQTPSVLRETINEETMKVSVVCPEKIGLFNSVKIKGYRVSLIPLYNVQAEFIVVFNKKLNRYQWFKDYSDPVIYTRGSYHYAQYLNVYGIDINKDDKQINNEAIARAARAMNGIYIY
jgi:hypothetical protein